MSLFYHNPTVTKQSQESIHRTMQQTGAKKSDIGEDPVMMGVWSSAGTNAQSRHMVCVVSKHSRRSTRAHHGAVYEQRETCAWAEGKKRIVIPIELVQCKLKQLDFITSFISCIVQTYRKSTHAFGFLLKKKYLVRDTSRISVYQMQQKVSYLVLYFLRQDYYNSIITFVIGAMLYNYIKQNYLVIQTF